ncbi:MAG: zf-HC2 domain-containing protein [Actinomycetota bacterium]
MLREIELYLDEELETGLCHDIEEHLAGCSPCLQRKEFKETLRALVAKKCGPGPAPEELLGRIRDLLAAEPPG